MNVYFSGGCVTILIVIFEFVCVLTILPLPIVVLWYLWFARVGDVVFEVVG